MLPVEPDFRVRVSDVDLDVPQPARLLGRLDLDQVHGLAQARRRSQRGRVQRAPAGRDDLPAAAVDGVRVHHHVAHLAGQAPAASARAAADGHTAKHTLAIRLAHVLAEAAL